MLSTARYLGRVHLTTFARSRPVPALLLKGTFHNGQLQRVPSRQSFAAFHVSPVSLDDKIKNSRWPFHITMTDKEKREKQEKIDKMKEEEEPKTLFGKIKYYIKRYWYIAVPAHMVGSTLWFGSIYAVVQCGVDVVAILRALHIPAVVIEKIENVPPSAGVLVVALLLYKVATPLRYMTTLFLIQAAFWTLRRMGRLRTAREVEFRVRTEYEKNKLKYGRKLYRYRNMGVRDVSRKHSQGQLKKDSQDRSDRDS